MNVQERLIITEMQLKIQAAERRGRLEAALAEARQDHPSLRERAATLLVSLADRLSPEAVVAFKEEKPLHHV